MTTRPAPPWGSYACLALGMTLTGVYISVCKPLGAVLPVFLLAWLRFCITALPVIPWLAVPAGGQPLTRRSGLLIFLQSFFGNFLFTVFMIYGLQLTTAVSAGVIFACIPAAVALLSRVFLRERISRRTMCGIVCGMAGIALLSLNQVHAHQSVSAGASALPHGVLLGDALIFATVFCEAVYVVIGKKLTEDISPKRIAALLNFCGLAMFTVPGIYQALSFDFRLITLWLWGLLAFYALFASIICVWLWMTGVKKVPASQSGVFTVMLPVGTVLTGVVFLGEHLTLIHLIAFALAIAGLLLATTRSGASAGK